ncbi:kinase-like domain-containing protein [Xylaria grammica]|nr:kinase-like domain-containing protein [Xylaria grammica]
MGNYGDSGGQKITLPTRTASSMTIIGTCCSNVKYTLIEEVEYLGYYQQGGYHPTQINDRLHNRYRIVHKLGHGTFSTVWLAVDERTYKYVAVKVGISDTGIIREADILSQLGKRANAVSSRFDNRASMIRLPLDFFDLDGPNGTHPCIVTVLARCSLQDAKQAPGPGLFQLDVARSLAAQLTMAVSLIHSQGYAHGDLHLGNVLLHLPSSIANLSVDQLYANFGAPKPERILREDRKPIFPTSGVPSHAIPPVWLGIASHKIPLAEAKSSLTDFGTAFRPSDKSRFESYTPMIIQPPEAFFEPETSLSFASDIWSLGCTIFELFSEGPLMNSQDEIIAEQVHLQGPLPAEWWAGWKERSQWFDGAGRPLGDDCDIWPWDRRFDGWIQEPRQSCGMDVIKEGEKTELLALLRWMLTWKPEGRPSAEEVLDSAWMKKWAFPAYEQSGKG